MSSDELRLKNAMASQKSFYVVLSKGYQWKCNTSEWEWEKKKKIHQLLYLGASLAERKSRLTPSSIIIANTFLVKNETTINIEISNVSG